MQTERERGRKLTCGTSFLHMCTSAGYVFTGKDTGPLLSQSRGGTAASCLIPSTCEVIFFCHVELRQSTHPSFYVLGFLRKSRRRPGRQASRVSVLRPRFNGASDVPPLQEAIQVREKVQIHLNPRRPSTIPSLSLSLTPANTDSGVTDDRQADVQACSHLYIHILALNGTSM